MALVPRFVDAPSGAGTQDGITLANAFGSLIDVANENPAGATDDLVIELHGGTDDPGARLRINMTGATVTINVKSGTYQLDNTTNFRDGIELEISIDFGGDFAFRCRTSAATDPGAGIDSANTGIVVNFNKGAVVVDNAGTTNPGFRCGGGTLNVDNLVVDNAGGDGAVSQFNVATPVFNIDHGTITNCTGTGVLETSNTLTARNVYAGGNTTDFSAGVSQTTCASSDTTADGTGLDSIAFNTTNFESVTNTDIDIGDPTAIWGVPKVASGLQGAGTDIGVVLDYRQATRPSIPDIGALEHAAVVPGGRIMSSLAYYGGLAGKGGIAGQGGGLAG